MIITTKKSNIVSDTFLLHLKIINELKLERRHL